MTGMRKISVVGSNARTWRRIWRKTRYFPIWTGSRKACLLMNEIIDGVDRQVPAKKTKGNFASFALAHPNPYPSSKGRTGPTGAPSPVGSSQALRICQSSTGGIAARSASVAST